MAVINLIGLVWKTILLILGALPLYYAVKLLGGKVTIFKVVIINFITGLLFFSLKSQFDFLGSVIAIFLSLWLYKQTFHLNWIKSVIVTLIAAFIIYVFMLIFTFLFLLFKVPFTITGFIIKTIFK